MAQSVNAAAVRVASWSPVPSLAGSSIRGASREVPPSTGTPGVGRRPCHPEATVASLLSSSAWECGQKRLTWSRCFQVGLQEGRGGTPPRREGRHTCRSSRTTCLDSLCSTATNCASPPEQPCPVAGSPTAGAGSWSSFSAPASQAPSWVQSPSAAPRFPGARAAPPSPPLFCPGTSRLGHLVDHSCPTRWDGEEVDLPSPPCLVAWGW